MLINDGEPKEELPEEKNHMVRMAEMTTVWGEMEFVSTGLKKKKKEKKEMLLGKTISRLGLRRRP